MKLDDLEDLDFSYRIYKVPSVKDISDVKSLRDLLEQDNQLNKTLLNINYLRLCGKGLKEIPVETFILKNLEYLDLSNNYLSRIPKKIGQLRNLKYLDFSSNQISNVPKELCRLKNLHYLLLSNNKIKELPKEITFLEYIWNRNNKSTYKSGFFYFGGNPLEFPPTEIVVKGRQAVINYFRQIENKGKDILYEAKLLIVGEPSAGKTTLSKKIENPSYQINNKEQSTEGIDVKRLPFKIDEKQYYINIWDFGGQEIYHATHQFFLTKRSLYAMVSDRKNTDFDYWLNIVSLLSDNSPLLIIKNEKQDKVIEIDECLLRGQFKSLKDILTTNFATNRGLDSIIKSIKHYISSLSHIGTTLPNNWINVRKQLEKDSRMHINLEQYLQICEENGFTYYNDKLQLSEFLHDIGVCLHFQEDPILKHTLILKPEWATDAVYKVLDKDFVKKNMGEFLKDDLKSIWYEKKYEGMQDELLQLMMKFKLCYEIPYIKGTFICPQLLSEKPPTYEWDNTDNIYLNYKYDFMPKGIISLLIVNMHKYIANQTLVWKSGVVLQKDNTKSEIIEYYHQRTISIRISGLHKKDLMTIVMHEFDKIHDSYNKLKVDKKIPCICKQCRNTYKPYFYSYEDLQKRLGHKKYNIECKISYETVNIIQLIDDIVYDEAKSNINKSQKSFETDKTIIQRLIMGDNIQFSGNGNNIAFGKDNAKIKQTILSHSYKDNDLKANINQLKDEVSKLHIDETNRDAMDFQIEILESQSTNDKINPIIINTALDNLKKIAIGALGSAAGSSLFEIIKRIGTMFV